MSYSEERPHTNERGEGPYTKFIAVGTVVLVLLTYLLTAGALHWWPFKSSNDPAPPCTFDTNGMTCSSSNPQVVLEIIAAGDTTGCSTEVEIQWGDTSAAEIVDHSGGLPGTHFLANHTYTTPGTYSIYVTGAPLNGCSFNGGSYTFTLLG